ncbi:S1 family peptidase [Actinomadura monticuli]|uniref:S1 family peptidase n=1 Tax=Actinomadura monticuli TaxID=3097367 RepID=A0ABV4QMW5_9ACTN
MRRRTLTAAAVAVLAAFALAAPARAAAPSAEGGQPIFAPGGVRCTLGFNVRQNGTYYFLTAGGCAKVGLTVYADPALTVELGTVVAVTNVAVGLVRYVDPQVERPGSVRLYPGSQDITGAGSPVVGQRVCRSGPTTGLRCGTVTAVNLTVRFPEGTITGLARTTICVEPGDTPGAPYFSGGTAIGLGIGGTGSCATGGSSYVQPVTSVLAAFGVTVY